MITNELVEYIKSQLSENLSKQEIVDSLIGVGWEMKDIEEGFDALAPKIKDTPVFVNEPIVEENNPVIDFDEQEKKDDSVEIFNLELNSGPNTNEIKEEKIIPETEEIVSSPEPIIPKILEPKVEQFDTISPVEDIKKTEETPSKDILEILDNSISKKGDVSNIYPELNFNYNNESQKQEEDLIPVINKQKENTENKIENIEKAEEKVPVYKPISSNKAMISSYSLDIVSAKSNQNNVDIIPTIKSKSKLPLILILIGVLLFVGGVAFAFIEGYVKIPWSNLKISFVKKDPKYVILNNAVKISELDNYKVDNQIDISIPSLSSITTGLASGESSIDSSDVDLISVISKGKAKRLNNKLIFEQDIELKSSMLKNNIETNIKFDGENMFIKIPELKELLGGDSPEKGIVMLSKKDFSIFMNEISSSYKDLIKDIDAYNISSGEIPLYVKNEASSILTEFINRTAYLEKEEEVISGVETHHYEIIVDRQSTKKFLNSMSDLLIVSLPEEQKKKINGALGASSVSSFDVWIGKDDGILYKTKISLNIPLSKILNLNDSGIAGGEVKVDWSMNYYDLNTENKIEIPEDHIKIDDFIKETKNIKIKNILNSFNSKAIMLKNAIGSYGAKANGGSCLSPTVGSLYSPTGHTKGANSAVASISLSLNSLLTESENKAVCYSNAKSWALSVPLYSNSEKLNFYCVDSSGNSGLLEEDIKSTICK